MVKANELAGKINNNLAVQQASTQITLKGMLGATKIKERFEEILGKKAPGFISSILSIYNSNAALQKCDPNTIISAAVVAATLDLPINQNLGFAYIIPYGTEATFQLGYKGFIQLAQRTGLYKTINAAEVYEGEIKYRNRITGEIEFDFEGKTSDKIIGYVSYFKLINGFERFLYMTVDDVKKHAKKFSKTYGRNGSIWTTEFDAMALKTVTKLNLSKYGVLSIEMQKALETDSAVINGVEDEPNVSFVDNPEYTIQPDDVIITPTGETTVTNTEDVKPEQENMFKGSPLE